MSIRCDICGQNEEVNDQEILKLKIVDFLYGYSIYSGIYQVNNPQHYQSGGLQAIDVIEAFELNFRTGNAVKYILRAGKKNPEKHIEDLKKAVWYLNRQISKLEQKNG